MGHNLVLCNNLSCCDHIIINHILVTHIATWMSAFRIFVRVSTLKYPHESRALITYGEIVQNLAEPGQNWRFTMNIFVSETERTQRGAGLTYYEHGITY